MSEQMLARLIRSAVQAEAEKTPRLEVAVVSESQSGQLTVSWPGRSQAASSMGSLVSGLQSGDTVLVLTGPTPVVLGVAPFRVK